MYNHLLLHVQGRLVLAGDGGDVQVPARLYGHSFPSKQLETKEGGEYPQGPRITVFYEN